MKPLSSFAPESARALLGLVFDLDDTLLDDGRLSTGALDALYRLSAAGLILLGATGRPAAWGQVLTRQWPVSGMVTENGIIALAQREGRIEVLDRIDREARTARRRELGELVAAIQAEFPDLEPSDDVMGRLADYSFDIAESRVVPADRVRAAADFARARGARVVQSSIQLHVSLDADDKASGVVRFLRLVHGIDPTAATYRFAFIGDSENDASCFAGFHHSFGVANLRGRPSLWPRYRAAREKSHGFIEIADALLGARSRLRP
ncbi:MAG TPA: HAD hydrolase family protein [Polyangiaceae bacterium]|nr:HAD hydrolase family protein [Polyangiaceae bacterium]